MCDCKPKAGAETRVGHVNQWIDTIVPDKTARHPFQIPKRFKLLGHTIEVEYDPMLDGKYGNSGEARYTTNTIALMPNIPGSYERPSSQQEHVFLHELTHHILHEMSEYDLRGNEKFVETFSGLLHQALTTSEFE